MKNTMMIAMMALLLVALAGCEDAGGTGKSGGSDGDTDGDGDGDADGDADSDADSDADTDTGMPSGSATVHGTVMAPSGTFPIPGALVYLTGESVQGVGNSNPIPDGIFCYECDDMTGKKWTLSNADGTFTLEQVPAGTWRLVTRKGYFRRIVEIDVADDQVLDVAQSLTTLPTDNSADGADRIPAYAVALNSWDRSQDLLAKLGIADLNSSGNVVFGTENFDIYNSDMTQTGYPGVAEVYASLESMSQYHMIFMPCTSSTQKTITLSNDAKKQQIRQYVAGGGKYYGSCYAYDWVEQPFPAMIEFRGNDAQMGSATLGSYNTNTLLPDEQMRDWMAVVAPASDPDHFQVTGAWVVAERVDNVDNGMGLEEDDGWVIPKVWAWDKQPALGWNCQGINNWCPMTVTYNFGCGKVFFSAYHVVESSSSQQIRPQEYVLLYLILEIGVCEGEYVDIE